MIRTLVVSIALLLALAPVAEAAPDSVELRLLSADASSPSPWAFVVPVPPEWTAVTAPDLPVAAMVRPFARDCELFLQVFAEPGPGSFPLARALKHVRRVERGQRFADAGGPRFVVNSRLARVGGLVIGLGATGPGGFGVLRFRSVGEQPDLALTAQGGTEGPGCFSVSVRRAPGLVLHAVRQIAAGTAVRYTP